MAERTASAAGHESLFLGIDVQLRRGVPVAVMDAGGVVRESVWFEPAAAAAAVAALVRRLGSERCQVGIDAPRMPLRRPRRWSFRAGRWSPDEGRIGRHCEIAVKALGLGNPQWTPRRADAPDWMRLGFALFRRVEDAGAVAHEVFPSVTYRQLDGVAGQPPVTLPLTAMAPGPKDMLDAVAAGFTVWRWYAGDGAEVGGGDGLGTILLPLAVPDHPVLRWPS